MYSTFKSFVYIQIRDIKCANLGPTVHSRSVKWDFAENLVPTPCPKVDIEAKRILPFLHNRINGMCVYVPTPDVSMFDLTIRFEEEDDAIIAAQKEKVILLNYLLKSEILSYF
jgi:glyceraldehyde-3-phosphate dehydrogenase/erythrose-4-phosphate dehydrogenase